MKNISKILILAALLITCGALHAEKYRGPVATPRGFTPRAASTCLPATNSNELTVNNVRAYLETNGTMWFEEIAQYEVPYGSGKTSMFAAALWIGGKDINDQLKLAAVRFRQLGDDFWTGPLTLNGASVSQTTCAQYDKFFKISRAEVEEHKNHWQDGDYSMPTSIRDWPAHPYDLSAGQSFYLAPFFDNDNDGEYHPENGDYPYYDLDNDLCPWTDANRALAAAGNLPKTPEERMGISSGMVYADHVLKGDETLYWIFNDKGGSHTESQGDPIGLEIRAQAFGFSTNDELNNMTFYSYEIINRSTYDLTQTYFSQWVDPDLGFADDDYVGCDVARGLGYCYNGRNVDGTGLAQHYGSQPPAVGVDFFQGPYLDPDGYDNPSFNGDGNYGPTMRGNCDIVSKDGTLDTLEWNFDPENYPDSIIRAGVLVRAEAINGVNFGDGIVDNERFGMRRFVYHNNDNSVVGDPSVAYEYYNMLRGLWKDNLKMKYGANAHPQNGATGPDCDFMFPGLTDPCNWGTMGVDPTVSQYGPEGWTEAAVGNAPADRRFMQSAGPFTLRAGAVNYITVGIPWARAASGGAAASVDALKIADDKCQALFENCFKVLDGPDAPDVTIEELENKLIIYLTNSETSNNFNESYEEADPAIPASRLDETIYHLYDTMPAIINGVDSFYLNIRDSSAFEETEYDRNYRFEGYMIYQCANEDVSVTDIGDLDKIRLIAQCDIQNEASQLVNWIYNDQIGVSAPHLMVDGENQGIRHTFVVTEDKFATTAAQLINHKKYYFLVLAYGYNNYLPYVIDPENINGLQGQMTPFLAGRRNIGDPNNNSKPYVGIPHNPAPENSGTIVNCDYGTQPMITRVEGQGNGGFFLDLTPETTDQILRDGKVDKVTYQKNFGPINVKVTNPLKVQAKDFIVKFLEEADEVTDTAEWVLQVLDANGNIEDEIYSAVPINVTNEQLIQFVDSATNEFIDYGLSISILNYPFQIHQSNLKTYVDNHGGMTYQNRCSFSQVDLIGSSITYADESKPWLSGVVDLDGNYPGNWIRSGQQEAGQWEDAGGVQEGVENDYSKWKTEDFFQLMPRETLNQNWVTRAWKDPESQFEGVVNGTWSPYVLSSPYYGGPQAKFATVDRITGTTTPQPYYWAFQEMRTNSPGYNQTLTNLYSVDIVLTPDKSKWTRCIVLESCDDPSKSEGGALAYEPRKHPSVDKNGNPDGTGDGMGWFPGYAINVETGERLNIMFAENSADPDNNGNDMLFNPTNVYAQTYNANNERIQIGEVEYNSLFEEYAANPNILTDYQFYRDMFPDGKLPWPCWGGRHYIYIVGSSGSTNSAYYRNAAIKRNYNPQFDCGAYDECAWLMDKFNNSVLNIADINNQARKNNRSQLFNNVMWTSIPMPAFREEDNWLSNEATVKIRVSRPYMRYSSAFESGPDVVENDNYPMYSFTTKDIAVQTNQAADLKNEILDKINIVPNPYYGYSTYEGTALETYAKIVNLPSYEEGVEGKVTISIYTVSGILIRKLTKGDTSTYVDWDLKNSANIPIASGIYIIHIDCPGIGERTLKFFAAMRPTDLNAF